MTREKGRAPAARRLQRSTAVPLQRARLHGHLVDDLSRLSSRRSSIRDRAAPPRDVAGDRHDVLLHLHVHVHVLHTSSDLIRGDLGGIQVVDLRHRDHRVLGLLRTLVDHVLGGLRRLVDGTPVFSRASLVSRWRPWTSPSDVLRGDRALGACLAPELVPRGPASGRCRMASVTRLVARRRAAMNGRPERKTERRTSCDSSVVLSAGGRRPSMYLRQARDGPGRLCRPVAVALVAGCWLLGCSVAGCRDHRPSD